MKQTYKFSDEQTQLINSKIIEFYNLVEEHSCGNDFDSFKGNNFLQYYENYKYEAVKNTCPILRKIISSSDFGSGNIRNLLISAIKEGKNLVNSFWRKSTNGVLNDLKGTKLKKFEKNLHDLYSEKMSDSDFFNYYTSEIAKRYPIVAYIFFLKDPKKYIPIATQTYDHFFEEVGLDFRTTAQCSWENYCEYLEVLNSIRVMLEAQLGFHVTMIDAHTFIWVCEDSLWNDWRIAHKKECSVKKKYTVQVVKSRNGQGIFRDRVIKKWQGKSSVSFFCKVECMKAAHIKPWKKCNEKDCLDADNGLLLTPNIDFLFELDNGYITFGDDGNVIFTSRLTNDIMKEFGITKDLKLKEVNEKTKKYLEYHREHVLKKWGKK